MLPVPLIGGLAQIAGGGTKTAVAGATLAVAVVASSDRTERTPDCCFCAEGAAAVGASAFAERSSGEVACSDDCSRRKAMCAQSWGWLI